MKFLQNIRVRLTLWYLLIAAILIVFFGGAAYLLLSDNLSRKAIDPWNMQWAILQSTAYRNTSAYNVTGLSEVAHEIGAAYQGPDSVRGFTRAELLSMADHDGVITLYMSGGIPILINKDLLMTPQMSDAQMIWFYYSNNRLLIVNQSAYSVTQTLGIFRQAILATAVVTLVLAAILGFLLISRMLRPVQAITRTAKDIGENNLGKRLDVNSKDELGDLASTLNQMLERLDGAFVREREFTADASHELRTPLAIAQGEASLALREERSQSQYRETLETVSRQISLTSSLINRLLFLARSDDRLELLKTDVDLGTLLNEAASDAQVLCEPKGIVLRSGLSCKSDSSERLIVRADAIRLRELFLNLLDNAVRYTPAGGTITLSLARQGDYARASVKDTGIGISPVHLPHIFGRFYRVDKSRSRAEGGAGLGLAISQRIAQIHGGRIEVESKVGQGSNFSVFLPLLYERKEK